MAGRRPAAESSRSVSVRAIDNGYIVSESSFGPDGYDSTETYSPNAPSLEVNPPDREQNTGSIALRAAMKIAGKR